MLRPVRVLHWWREQRRAEHQAGVNTAQYRRYWEDAAHQLSADFVALADHLWEVRLEGRHTRIATHLVQADDPVILHMAGDKPYCYTIAAGLGLPVPRHTVVRWAELGRAWSFTACQGGPVVVKPSRGSGGSLGVTSHVSSPLALARAMLRAALYGRWILVERLVLAETCRLLFLDGELIDAVRRRGVRVIGDGGSTIQQLITRRGLAGLCSDVTLRLTLAAQQFDLGHVPEAGREVVVRSVPAGERAWVERPMIYDENIMALIGVGLVDDATRVVAAVGSRFASVDVLTNDPTDRLEPAGGVFLEINTTPAIHHHQLGAPAREPVANQVLRSMLARPWGTLT